MPDKNPSHPIKINLATAKEIALLYGIGDKLSERIIAHRAQHGPFYSPSDLSNVTGISLQLAETLSTQIDWRIADEVVEDTTQPEYSISILFLALALFQLLNAYYLQIIQIKGTIARADTDRNVWLWIHINFLLAKFSVAFAFICLAVAGITTSVRKETTLIKLSVYSFLSALLCLLLVASGNVVYYQFYDDEGWSSFLDSPSDVITAIIGVVTFTLSAIAFVAWYWRQSTRTMRMMRFMFSFLILTATVISILWSYQYSSEVVKPSLPLTISQLGFGIFNIWNGFRIIFKQASPLDGVITLLDAGFSKALSQDAVSSIRWMRWLNEHIPNVEEQKDLQKALAKTYPPSKTKTFIGLVIIGLGGWLAVVALGAIIEWFVQGWLDKLWK